MRRSSSCRASTERASLWSGSPKLAMALQMSVSVMELNLARNTVFLLLLAWFMTGSTASRTWGRPLAVFCFLLLHTSVRPAALGLSWPYGVPHLASSCHPRSSDCLVPVPPDQEMLLPRTRWGSEGPGLPCLPHFPFQRTVMCWEGGWNPVMEKMGSRHKGEDEVRVTPPEGGSGLSTERGPGAKTH